MRLIEGDAFGEIPFAQGGFFLRMFDEIINFCGKVVRIVDLKEAPLVEGESLCCATGRIRYYGNESAGDRFKAGNRFDLDFRGMAVKIAEVDYVNKFCATLKPDDGGIFQIFLSVFFDFVEKGTVAGKEELDFIRIF